MLEYFKACPICSQRNIEEVFTVEDSLTRDLNILLEQNKMEGFPEISNCICRCKECKQIFLNPRLNKEYLNKLYETWYQYSYSEILDKDSLLVTNRLRHFQKYHLKRLKDLGVDGKKILDIGCGTGLFLSLCKQEGWDVTGVEFSPSAADYAKSNLGLDVQCKEFLQSDFMPNSFDVITMFDYLEHTRTPKEDLFRARELLKPGGFILGTTPNFRSLQSKIMQKKWLGIISDHLFYFTPQTLKQLLGEVGFEVERISDAHFVSLGEIIKQKIKYIKRRTQLIKNGNTPNLANKENLPSYLYKGITYLYSIGIELLDWLGNCFNQSNITLFLAKKP